MLRLQCANDRQSRTPSDNAAAAPAFAIAGDAMAKPIGRLPGDIVFQRGGATFYFPLATCIIVSIVLSALFWLLSR
jgi:hypothetical protein